MLKLNTPLPTLLSKSAVKQTLLLFPFLLLSACADQTPPENVSVWPMVKDCSLHNQACLTNNNEQSVRLKISPDPIPIAMPLGIELNIKNIQAKKIELDISGANMYMGYNRVTLIPDGDTGRYIGTTMLAFCTTEKMQWKITLMIHQKDGTEIQIPYLLETQMHEIH
ncbi:MAG: hypothetical protein L3J00_06700 [Thiomicrorhabdus sp.]|nr:hypothetical protein [Thiomicrorhabdus sp.]